MDKTHFIILLAITLTGACVASFFYALAKSIFVGTLHVVPNEFTGDNSKGLAKLYLQLSEDIETVKRHKIVLLRVDVANVSSNLGGTRK